MLARLVFSPNSWFVSRHHSLFCQKRGSYLRSYICEICRVLVGTANVMSVSSCAADPRLFIVGHLSSSLVCVDGESITQAIREEAQQYLAKGFSPATTDTNSTADSLRGTATDAATNFHKPRQQDKDQTAHPDATEQTLKKDIKRSTSEMVTTASTLHTEGSDGSDGIAGPPTRPGTAASTASRRSATSTSGISKAVRVMALSADPVTEQHVRTFFGYMQILFAFVRFCSVFVRYQ